MNNLHFPSSVPRSRIGISHSVLSFSNSSESIESNRVSIATSEFSKVSTVLKMVFRGYVSDARNAFWKDNGRMMLGILLACKFYSKQSDC
jgi:hypothetical protein